MPVHLTFNNDDLAQVLGYHMLKHFELQSAVKALAQRVEELEEKEKPEEEDKS